MLEDGIETNREEWLSPCPSVPAQSDAKVGVPETTKWYDEVKAFTKKNKIIDSSIPV